MLSSSRIMTQTMNAMKRLAVRPMSANVADVGNYKFETLAVTSPKDFVLHVELNRPDKLNAMNNQMWSDMISCFDIAAKDSNVRAIVVSGKGRMFTAGLDLMAAASSLAPDPNSDVARNAFRIHGFIKFAQESCNSIERCSKPVLVSVHGGCVGGGVDLITACDVRLCTNESYFCAKEIDVGLAPDVGTLQRLPKVIGNDSVARELCLTARKLEADEAKQIGLVSRVYDDKDSMMEAAMELASLIATKSPVAVQSTKIHMNYSRDHTTQEGLDYMASWNAAMLQTEDITKSAQAFMAKKTPADVEYSKL
ncbi:delta(3,5)-Delta(2,4)-dienoyl-CoA isomerase, mitochondrial-like isoform X2 [Styela clava]|uniref:delta(3,5)-Delta(2,4)-dienoyl-CoA isomerase, mitochondrial-like isoform X2 n=1 Tax=Styela clava TaxID=7725 RepID=UPI00193A23F0|nr:delta(3,5)-Delta(2,4)-dienoyl-CoA isomerase, mitochondrial-like isoform X2 [Styela clava]